MTNDQLINNILRLKEEGITFKYIANSCDIPTSSFYYYIKNNKIPYFARKQIEEFLLKEFKEIIKDE